LEVHIITNGHHQKGGNTAETYDGPLTDEGRKMILALIPNLPDNIEEVWSGMTQRHKETAKILGFAEPNITNTIGCDYQLFDMLEGKDNAMVKNFWDRIQSLKSQRLKSVLIITSRSYLLLMQYLIRGGEECLGPFRWFNKSIDEAYKWKDTIIPLNKSGTLHTFEI